MSNPFPTEYPKLLVDDWNLQKCLTNAFNTELEMTPSLYRVAISFVAIEEKGNPLNFKHASAGLSAYEEFYSASLLKVGALYAAYELMKSVNILARGLGWSTPSDFISQIHSVFDQSIIDEVPTIPTKVTKQPDYDKIFTIPSTSNQEFEFNPTFNDNLREMIVYSNNNAAGYVINALGYNWINGALAKGGFFNPQTQKGIWLAGTFNQSLDPVRIHSENDGDSAQATTCWDMANLYANMYSRGLVSVDDSDSMLNLLHDAAKQDLSWIDSKRAGNPQRSFQVAFTKIGQGPLSTPDHIDVLSEATVLQAYSQMFLVVWQNSIDDDNTVVSIGNVVEETIRSYLGQ